MLDPSLLLYIICTCLPAGTLVRPSFRLATTACVLVEFVKLFQTSTTSSGWTLHPLTIQVDGVIWPAVGTDRLTAAILNADLV